MHTYDLISETDNHLNSEFDRVYQECARIKKGESPQNQTEDERIKTLKDEVQALEKKLESVLLKEIGDLVLEARSTKWKREESCRSKIVALQYVEIIKHEAEITKEYIKFFSREDIEFIKEKFPEVIALKEEPMILLRMAWEKVQETDKAFVPTPDQWRATQINRTRIQAQDDIAARLAVYQAGIENKLSAIRFRKQTHKKIEEANDLTAEEKEELKDSSDQILQAVMEDEERPKELI